MKFLLPLVALSLFFLIPFLIPLFPQEEYLYPIYAKDSSPSSRFERRLEKIDAKRDKERIASRAASLKEKLSKFRDKRKAAIAERVNDNLNKINERRTDAMLRHLNRMSEILAKISGRVSQATSSGQVLTEAQTAITDAQSAIDSAKEAVKAQAEKDYTIEATAEARIRDESKAKRDSLHQDLKAVHDLVVAARKAVANAISTGVSSLKGVRYGQ